MTRNSTAVRISDPADLVETVPYLLGFTPSDSLVIVGLSDRRVVVTARLDAGTDALEQTIERLRPHISAAYLITYGDAARDWRTAYSLALAAGLEVVEVLEVDAAGVKWMSLLCAEKGCRCGAHQWQPISTASTAAATLVAAGSAPHGTRDDISAEVAPADWVDPFDAAHAARLLELDYRDAVLIAAAEATTADDPDRARKILGDAAAAARSSTGDARAMALTTAATVAFLLGQGGRANVYAETVRTEGLEPPTLLPLLETFMDHALPPSGLARAFLEA